MKDPTISSDEILKKITLFFCNSRDFNGIRFTSICETICEECFATSSEMIDPEQSNESLLFSVHPCRGNTPWALALFEKLEDLIDKELITVVYDINPHIKRLPDRPKVEQKKLIREKFSEVCLYPVKSEVLKQIDLTTHQNSPYLVNCWECQPILSPIYFDLEVLENYSNDPRYVFNWHDFTGSIHLTKEHYESLEMKPRDQIYLEHFGLGYKENDGTRVASVPLRYLARLTPEHQQRWKTFELDEQCIRDPDYYKTSIIGAWPVEVSIYTAFIHEIDVINQLCKAANLPPLFRDVYTNERPKYFRIPFRNTKEAYHRSIEEIDKMVSQNLNKSFFETVLKAEETFTSVPHRKSGKEAIQELGTLALLKQWIESRFSFRNDKDKIEAFEALSGLNNIRKIRQTPAHRIQKDAHNRTFSDLHDENLRWAYRGLRTLRLILTNHPSIRKQVDMPPWLFEGKIRLFSWKKLDEDHE